MPDEPDRNLCDGGQTSDRFEFGITFRKGLGQDGDAEPSSGGAQSHPQATGAQHGLDSWKGGAQPGCVGQVCLRRVPVEPGKLLWRLAPMRVEILLRPEACQAQGSDTANDQVAALRPDETQREIRFSSAEVYDRVARDQFQTQAGMFPEEVRQGGGDELTRDHIWQRDPNDAAQARVEPIDHVPEFGRRSFEQLGPRNNFLRRCGGDQPLGHPVEEANAEVALESRNPSADGALIDTEASTRGCAASLTEGSQEYAEIVPALHLLTIARLQRSCAEKLLSMPSCMAQAEHQEACGSESVGAGRKESKMKDLEKQNSVPRFVSGGLAAASLVLVTLTACGSPVRHVRTLQPEAVATTSADEGVPPGTSIPVVAVLQIASRKAASDQPTTSGQQPYFVVMQDVANSEGTVVVHEGTEVMASVARRRNPRIGRPGWMEVSFKSTTGVNGTVVRLDDSPQRFEGKSRIKGSITLAVLTYGLGLLRTGGDVTLPEGTGLVARVVD
jgi:hypothetical protein